MKYDSAGLSEIEIPVEKNLVINITDNGDLLLDNFNNIFNSYRKQISCVCFVGEGKIDFISKEEFKHYCQIIHRHEIKAALYSNRDVEIEKWMYIFDYIKLGSENNRYGPITKEGTNQKLYKKIEDEYRDITHIFWK